LSKENYFSNKEYLLGDLAFSASTVMVPAFKKGQNANLSEDESTSTQSWRKCELRVNIALGSSRLDFNMYKDSDGCKQLA